MKQLDKFIKAFYWTSIPLYMLVKNRSNATQVVAALLSVLLIPIVALPAFVVFVSGVVYLKLTACN